MERARHGFRAAAAAIACASCAALVGIEDKEPYPAPADAAPDEEPVVAPPEDAAPKIEIVVADVPGVYGLAIDDTYLYFTSETQGKVYRRSRAGGPVETIAEGQAEPREIAVDGTRVYWHASNAAGRTELDGGAEVPLLLSTSKADIGADAAGALVHEAERTVSPFLSFALSRDDDGWLVVSTATEIRRYRRQGGADGVVAANAAQTPRAPTAVGGDDTFFYWFQQNNYELWRRLKSAVGGAQPPAERIAVVPDMPDVRQMVVDTDALYFVTGGGIAAKFPTPRHDAGADAGPEGATAIELATGFPEPRMLTDDATHVFFTRGDDNGEVVGVHKTAGPAVVIAKEQKRPRGIAVRSDGTTRWVYWAVQGEGVIKRAPVP